MGSDVDVAVDDAWRFVCIIRQLVSCLDVGTGTLSLFQLQRTAQDVVCWVRLSTSCFVCGLGASKGLFLFAHVSVKPLVWLPFWSFGLLLTMLGC